MKINSDWRLTGNRLAKTGSVQPQPVQQQDFSDFLQQQEERASQEHLKQLWKKIDLQGERLAKSMTVRELRQYKILVKQFLEATVRKGVGLKETRGTDRRGRTKRYKILEEIDKQLLEMAEDLLKDEQGRMQILQQLGEVRGMLINYFF